MPPPTFIRLTLLAAAALLVLPGSRTLCAAASVSGDGAPAQTQDRAAGAPVAAEHRLVYTLPPDRVTTWNPGVPGGIPHYTMILVTLQAPTYDNGKIDARAAIQNALNAAGAAAAGDGIGRVVALSAGTFQISGELYLPSRVVLRGAGPDATRLVASGNKHPLIVIGVSLWPHPGGATTNVTRNGGMANETKLFSHPGGTTDLAATGVKGSYSVQAVSATGFAVGQLVYLDEITDNVRAQWNLQKHPPGKWRNWYSRDDRPITQILEIAAINGNTITFHTPLHIDFRAAQSAQLSRFDVPPVWFAGLEELRVSSGRNGNIQLDHAACCWVSHVESDDSFGSCLLFRQSYRCTVRDSYLHDSYYYNNGGAGYGFDVTFGSSDNLIENNISIRFNKVINCRASGGGNVIAYNYMDDGAMNSEPDWIETGLQASHYPTPHFELFEGNYCFNIDGDFTEGNAIDITYFRNQASGLRRNTPRFLSDTRNRRIAAAMKGHYWYNFVGNVLGYAGMEPTPPNGWVYEGAPPWPDTPITVWRIGYWNQDWNTQDPVVGATMIRDGNYDFVTSSVHWHHTPGFAGTLPDSLYLAAKPSFFGDNPWPWVDPLGPVKTYTLPAKARYDAGKPNG
ncbi:MAG TPA: hypothetical protein VLW52_07600 [Opitutaceae bacterium]|nr:hypothetical protein [Opitutaceae bacterium]